MDPSGKLPVLELCMISIRCSSVINHSWLDHQPRAGSARGAPTPVWLPGSTFTPLSCPPASTKVSHSSGSKEQDKSSPFLCLFTPLNKVRLIWRHFTYLGTFPALMKHWDAVFHRCIFSQFKAENKQHLCPCTFMLSVCFVNLLPTPTGQ